MVYVGLTGNIASGKSEVSRLLAEHGATVVDADVLAREAVEPGTPGFERVVARWGREVLAPDGTLDRGRLRHIAFGDGDELEALNSILHPMIGKLRRARVTEARKQGASVVVYVAPLLFERHIAREFSAQMPAELKRARADFVIENDGSIEELEQQVNDVWQRLTVSEERSSLAV
jgi:dephospho-CoA kinase